jgi:hypothetical protein
LDVNESTFRSLDFVEDNFAEAIIQRPIVSAVGRFLLNAERLAVSLVRSSHTVLGYRLLPFSAWHAAQLDFLASPYAGHDAKLDFAALYIACQICSTRYPQAFSQSSPLSVERWALSVGRLLRRRFVRRYGLPYGKSKQRFLRERNKFALYLRDYAGEPEYILPENAECRPAKTPWYLAKVAALIRAGLSLRCAWNFPLGEGNWLVPAANEARGARIDILQPSDRKQLAERGIE